MTQLNRIIVPGIPHHVTQRGVQQMNIFESDIDREFYIKLLAENAEKYNLEILCWCLMTNHIHLIVIPGSIESLSKGTGEIHLAYARSFNSRHDKSGALFQGRFYSAAMSEYHMHAAVRYVLCNPVRARMTDDPTKYQWSSAAFHAGRKQYDPLVSKPNILDSVENWDEYLSIDTDNFESIRKNTKTGRPWGDNHFIETVECITGISIKKKNPGPKPANK